MGIGPHSLRLTRIVDEARLLKRPFKVIELGSQDFAPTLDVARDVIAREFDYSDTSTIMVPADFYKRLGASSYECIDLDGYFGAYTFDLNSLLSAKYEFETQYDLVTNHGTTEHLINQMTAFENVHNLTKVGGVMIHALPFQGYQNHGMFNYNPSIFLDLAIANNYDVFGLFLSIDDKLYLYDEEFLERHHIPASADVLVLAVLIRTDDAEFKLPYDGRYFATKGRGEVKALETHIGKTSRSFGNMDVEIRGLDEYGEEDPEAQETAYHFITPIWGVSYVSDFINVSLPSQLSDANLGVFSPDNTLYTIVTCREERRLIQASPAFKGLSAVAKVRFILHTPEHGEHAYERMSRCYNLALATIKNPQACFFLTSDDFYADGLFRTAKEQLDQGKRVVMVPTIRVVGETFSTDLAMQSRKVLPPDEVVAMMLRHEHPMITSCVVNDAGQRLHRQPSQTLYRAENGYVGRWNVMHPLAVKVPARPPIVRSTVDWNYPALNIRSTDDVYIVRDSDVGIIASLSPYAYSQSEQIQFGGSRLKRVKNLQSWIQLDWALNFHVLQMTKPVYVHSGPMSDEVKARGLREVDSVWAPFFQFIKKHKLPVPGGATGSGLDMLMRAIHLQQSNRLWFLIGHAYFRAKQKLSRKVVTSVASWLR